MGDENSDRASRLGVGDVFPLEKLGVSGPAVIYFYPKDSTRGCELESRAFNAIYDDFMNANVAVIGVSAGSRASADAFANECGLRFPLVPDETLCHAVGLMRDFGASGWLPARTTFLVDADGTIQKVWDVDEVTNHPQDVLRVVGEANGM